MLEVTSKFLYNKCLLPTMFQDFYNVNRSWYYTQAGRPWKNVCNEKGNNEQPARNHVSTSNNNSSSTINLTTNGGFEFSLMNYNILSQDLIQSHSQLYSPCEQSSLDWPQRGERICRELTEANPDILCLQEVNSVHHAHFYKPFFTNHGYAGLFKKRTGNTWDGCALFYKKDKFILLDHIELEFYRKDMSSLLNRDNVAIIGVLKPILPESFSSFSVSNRLVIATTHLLFNPVRGDIKLAQTRLLLAELEKASQADSKPGEQKFCDIILCGDMNSKPGSPLYNFLTKGYLDTLGYRCGDISGQSEGFGRGALCRPCDLDIKGLDRSSRYITSPDIEVNQDESDWRSGKSEIKPKWSDNCNRSEETGKYKREDFLKTSSDQGNGVNEMNSSRIEHNFNLISVYPDHDENNIPLVTTHHGLASCMVDYIFYNRSETIKLLGYSQLFNREQMKAIGYLPNYLFGSDHLSLQAKFLIKLNLKRNLR